MTELVTRHIPLNFERKPAVEAPSAPFFVDWLSLHQTHVEDLPIINAGVIQKTDVGGEIVWRTTAASKVEGSHETSVQVRCDGHTVTFSGNVSRFGRPDNLFGFDLATCLRRVNQILARVGLPPFTIGLKFERLVKTQAGLVSKTCWTGCQITRIDLTANFETGSLANARAYMEWLATQQNGSRMKVGTHADGETVDWGRGSRRLYAKCYLKSAEIKKHGGPVEVAAHCEEVGLIRFELTIKATQLHSMNCAYLGGFDMNVIEGLFQQKRAVLTQASHTVDELENLPRAFRCTARDWLAGDDIGSRVSPATFRRHRAALLPYGIDIAVRRNVIEFKPRVRVIEVRSASVPCWYDLPRLAA